MANKYHPYFGQVITDSEMSEILDSLFDAIDRFVQDFGYKGIVSGGTVTQHSPNNLTVDVAASIVYDQAANRTEFGSPVVVNCALDENGAATAVSSSGNQKWLSLFLETTSTPSDPRTDDRGNSVYYKDVSGYQINVVQGSQAPTGTAVRPSLRGDQILLADVLISFGTSAIVNGNISTTRTQVIFDVTGSPVSVSGKSLTDVITQLVTAMNVAIAAQNAALAAQDAEIAAIDVDNLAADAVPGSPVTISAGNVHSVFVALLAAINAIRNDATYAKTNAANTFTQKQTIDVTVASTPLLTTTKGPADDSHGGNAWMLIEEWGNTRMYYGLNAGAATGGWAIVYNARWVPASPNGHWEPVTTAQGASYLSFNYGNLYYTAVRAQVSGGPSSWNDWPDFASSDRGDIFLGRDLHAKAVVGNTLSALTGDATVAGEVKYPSPKARTMVLTPAQALVSDGALKVGGSGVGGRQLTATAPVNLTWQIRLPPGATLGACKALFDQNTSSNLTLNAFKTVGMDFDAPDAGTVTKVQFFNSNSSTGLKTLTVDFGGLTVDASEIYEVNLLSNHADDVIYGLRVSWNDPGPLNH